MVTQVAGKTKNQKPTEKKPAEVPAVTTDPAMAERFTAMVLKEFSAIMGAHTKTLSETQKRLAQHLFAQMDATLQELEKKRLDKNDTTRAPIIWANINTQKLALDAVHRIELGLDALIPNHIWPIPYWNKRLKKYNVDLRIGYVGKDFYRRKMAINPPKDIRYELVHEKDKLTVFMKSRTNLIETYEFEVPEPFNRGGVKGGFAYLEYEEPSMNKIVLLSMAEFNKSKALAQTQEFWGNYPEKMQYKTLVLRATDRLQIDPAKVTTSFLVVENDDATDAEIVQSQIEDKANKGEVLDLKIEPETGSQAVESSAQETTADPVAPATCVCDQMTKEKLKEWDCPVHGRYQGGKFTKDLFGGDESQKRKPNF